MSAAQTAALHQALQVMALQPKRLQAQPDEAGTLPATQVADDTAGAAWELTLAPGLVAELMFNPTSQGDALLTLSLATEAARDSARWLELDTFAQALALLARPVRLVRQQAELGCVVQARAEGQAALVELLPELVVLMRRSVALFLDPWVALARHEMDHERALLAVASQLERARSGQDLQ